MRGDYLNIEFEIDIEYSIIFIIFIITIVISIFFATLAAHMTPYMTTKHDGNGNGPIAVLCDFYWKFSQNEKLESPLYCGMLIFITLIHHPRSKYSYMCVLTGAKSKSFIA